MYTIGQVAKFLGVTRDTLKFYEEKGLVNPKKNEENGYRQYSNFDIYDVLTTNFYREIELEIKKIQEIRQSQSVEEIELILHDKEERLRTELESKRLLLERIQCVRNDCEKIMHHIGEYSIREMKPFVVKGEISEFTAYDEYDILQKNTKSVKKAVVVTDLWRVIRFDDKGIIEDKFVVGRELDPVERMGEEEVWAHPRCLYTIIEDGRYATGGARIDEQVGNQLRKIAFESGYKLKGVVYVSTLMTAYKEGLERIFLEIYAPID
jgi:DNA-binding transcriptional MerR regulator